MAAFFRHAYRWILPLVICWWLLAPAGAFAAAEAEHGGAHHDPYDLTAANASPALEDPSEWRYDMSLCTFIVFLVLLTLLWRFAWGPIMDGLESRERFIVGQIESAKQSADRAAEELRAYQAKLAGAAQEAMAVVAQARKDAETVAEKIHAEAQADAARERNRAIAEIQAAKHAALRDMARRGTDLAVSLAGRIVRRELQPADHVALITEALEQFPSAN